MSKILIPSSGPDSWKQFLAKPDLHWAVGFSARTLAHAWEAADGVPPEVGNLMTSAFGSSQLLFALPEHKTALPGGKRESQSDIFALVRHDKGLATYTIEGKVNEPFGQPIGQWIKEASPGKGERLSYLCALLGISTCPPDVHYQLLHRTASALIEAERFDAKLAGMIVHSFSSEKRWFEVFARFAHLLGCNVEADKSASITVPSGKTLMLGWATGEERFLFA